MEDLILSTNPKKAVRKVVQTETLKGKKKRSFVTRQYHLIYGRPVPAKVGKGYVEINGVRIPIKAAYVFWKKTVREAEEGRRFRINGADFFIEEDGVEVDLHRFR